jgi:sugar lactone lactonase YvrE
VVGNPIALGDSIQPVEQSALNGAVDTRRPFISRAILKAEEASAPMDLELPLKMRNLAELEARVAKGEKIAPKEMAAKYEPTAQDYQAVVEWAKSQKLTILRQDDHHLGLFVRGSVSQIAGILGVNFARVTFRGREFTSATTAPTVPVALANVLIGINGLQPHLRPHKHAIRRQALPNATAAASAEYRPKQIAQAYNATSLYNNDITGSGQTIAIVIDTFPATSDLELFWSSSGINQSLSNIEFIQTVAGQLPDPSGEESLDTEWASGMAPGARVRVYAATDLGNTDLDQSYQQVLDDATNHPEYNIHQMTMSYGSGESDSSSSQLDTDHNLFLELTAAGVTCFASSGDGGSTPDDQGGESGTLQPENPASDPNVTGVGGTSLRLDSNNNETSETVWNDSSGAGGGGTSAHFDRPNWQTGTGVKTNAKRQVPDIAATADPQFGGVVFVGGQLTVYGGTSLASPICAALCSLVNQARGSQGPIPFLNADIYSQIGTSSFRDIVSGNNATSMSGGLYTATTGYDECTGVGVPLMQALTQDLAGTSTLVGVQYPALQDQVTPGQTATFSVAVGGASATYQWQRRPVGSSSFSNLGNTSTYSGATTATLTIANTTTAMSGDQFQCVVQLPSSTVTTAPPSNLAVETPQVVATFAGQTKRTGSGNGTGTAATFNFPSGAACDSNGNLYIADYGNNQIRKITTQGVVSTPFGSLSRTAGATNGSGNGALFNSPNAVATDGSDNIYVADSGNNLVRKIVGTTVSTLAGNFNGPQGIGVDKSSGTVYVADTGNNIVRRVTSGGSVTTLAGENGVSGYRDGAASQALFNGPEAIAVDSSGNVFVADFGNAAIREISNGQVTTVAGGSGAGYLDGRASSALFNAPTGLAFDTAGNLFITDSQVPSSTSNAAGNCVVRRLSPAGAVTTIAGDPGYLGSLNGTGISANFYSDQAIACSPNGAIYVADTYNDLVRQVGNASSGNIAAVTLTNLSATYDGTPKPISATTVPAGLTVNFTYDGSTTAPTDAGSYTVVGTVSDNTYSGSATGTLIISKAPATVTLGSLSAGFDGNPHGTTATTSPSGLTVVITYNGSITIPSAAGSYNVVASIQDANYTGTATGTFVISKPVATVTLSNLAVTYNGSPHSPTATTVPAGLGVIFTYNGSTVAPSAPGSYNVVGTINDANYSGSGSGTLVISQATPTITLSGLTATYNGKAHAVTATTVPARLPVTITYNGSATAPTIVGSYPVVATVSTVDYAGTASGTLNILPVAPLATTSAATTVGALTATLNGTANPEGSATSVTFQYGPTTTYGTTTSGQNIGSGSATVPVSASLGSLSPATLYHYRIVASSAGGTINGADKTFTTLAKPGYGTTSQALLAASGAQLIFSVNPNGLTTTVFFEYGTSAGNYTHQTATQSIGAGKAAINVMAFLSGLAPNTTYHFAVVMMSVAGTFTSVDQTFTTLGFDTTLVAQTGDVAVGTGGGTYATFHPGGVNAQDAVAFSAGLLATKAGPVTTANALGIWAEDATLTRQLVARQGATAPGTGGAVFATLTDPVYNNSEDLAFGGSLTVATGLVTSANANGVWASSGGSLGLLAREGSAAPGTGGATFATFPAVALSDSGGAIVSATLNASTAAGVTAANNAGVWEGTTAAHLTLMLRTGEQTNSGKTISAFKFLPVETIVNGQTRGFGPATGHLAAAVTYTDKNTGIVKVLAAASPQAVATSGDAAADATGSTAGGATFATFGSPAINDNDHTAFAATLAVGSGGTTKTNATGIWADTSSGTRKLIARLGQVAPGTGSNATYLTLSDPVYNANEAVAFRGTLSVGTGLATAATASGIWCNSTGSLQIVAQQGGPAPGCPSGVNYLAFTELALDDVDGATQQGGAIFLATLSGTGVTTANNAGIFAVDAAGTPQLIVRTGEVFNGKIITALAFLPAETVVNGQGRSLSQGTGDLVYTATFSDKSQALVNVVFP